MPRIPILPGDVPAAANDPFGSLPPAQADGLRALRARDDGIARGLTVAEAWRDGVAALRQAEGAEDGAPAGFAREFLADADRGRSTALRSTVPGQREALDDDLQELRADLGDRAVTAEAAGLALRRRLGLMQVLETYAGGVAEDPGLFDSADGRIAKLVEGLGLPEARANAVRTEMRTQLANAAMDGLMADPAEAEAALRRGLYDDVLPAAVKQQRLTEAETKLRRARLLDGERRRQTLSRRAAEGAADDAEIDAALADGGLSEYEADRLRLQTAQAQAAAETRRARIDRVAGGEALDPAIEEDRQAADAYWEDVSEAYTVDDPARQRQAELDLVRRLGVVPTGLAKTYRGMLLSRDPEIVVQGARAIREVEGIVGSGAVPAEESRRAARIMEFADLGVAADRAIELADAKVEERKQEPEAVTAFGDPIVDNDQTEPSLVGLSETENDDLGGILEDGSAVVIDPETGSEQTVDREIVERVDDLFERYKTLADLQRAFLDLYDQVEAGEITQEEATDRALALIREALPATNALGSPINEGASTRRTLERLATDLFEEQDRGAVETLFFDSLIADPEAVKEVAKFVLGFVPGIGELISAKDAYDGFLAALAAAEDGRTRDALVEAVFAGVSAIEAIPIFGRTVKLTRGGVKVAVAVSQMADTGIRRSAKRLKRGARKRGASAVGPTGRRIDGPVSARTLDGDARRAANHARFDPVETKTAIDINKTFPKNYDPLPYKPGTQVWIVRTKRKSSGEFVRVHGFGNQGSKKDGAWIMRKDDIRDVNGKLLSPSELKRRFALPHAPTHFSRVELPQGTTLRVGVTNPPSRAGGGDVVQFQILGEWKDNWFKDTKFLGGRR